ncbi:hypothetical protein SXCC_02425 [Gluconacetobacter sp. SXCC-1]|nr:hypothetical protein SXCC_02425 [Gluconacetobacter sp. SXCC-1]
MPLFSGRRHLLNIFEKSFTRTFPMFYRYCVEQFFMAKRQDGR